MKMETLLGAAIGAVAGGLAVYAAMSVPVAAAQAPAPAAGPRAIPSPGAGYAEMNFPNVNKYGLGAPFYTVHKGAAAQYPNGSVIYVD